jgi:hypothetical protein
VFGRLPGYLHAIRRGRDGRVIARSGQRRPQARVLTAQTREFRLECQDVDRLTAYRGQVDTIIGVTVGHFRNLSEGCFGIGKWPGS